MKKITFILIGLLINYMSVYGQNNWHKEPKAVKQVLINFFSGISNVDTASIRHNCTNDFRLVEDGTLWSIDSLTAYLPKATKATRINKLNFTKVSIKGKVARVSYHNAAHFIAPDGQNSYVNWDGSAVLVKSKNGWLINSLASTTLD